MITIFLLGLVVGLVLSVTGAGGGILAVPLLVFATGIGVAEAAPIGLVAVGVGAGLGALLGLRTGVVRYRAALLISVAGMLPAPFGLWLAHRMDDRGLQILFALVLLAAARSSYRKAIGLPTACTKNPPCVRSATSGRFIWTSPCALALARTGGVAGLLSGLLGVGGGFIIVPSLQRCTDLSMTSSVATSLAVIFLVSLHTVGLAIATDTLQWAIALPFCGGALAGMLAGRDISGHISNASIQKMFAAVAALAAVGLLATVLLLSFRSH